MEEITEKQDAEELKRILESHVAATGSKKGEQVLKDFENSLKHFKKIIPVDYKEILRLIAKESEKGADPENAKIEAFRVFTGEEN